jgi:YbgC/YbaW family acyl-CoA thioester hydrolase
MGEHIDKVSVSIELSRRLRWADTDATGRLHFPRIFEIIEEAESELLRTVGWPVGINESRYDFPRVHLDCSFYRMIMHDTPFRLKLSVERLGHTSIRYNFQVCDLEDELAIKGTMTVVVLQEGKSTDIPDALRSKLSGEIERSE